MPTEIINHIHIFYHFENVVKGEVNRISNLGFAYYSVFLSYVFKFGVLHGCVVR